MLDLLTDFLHNTWELTTEMAPYLLLGFAVAALLHVVIRADFIQRHLGKGGFSSVAKASLLGVPIPLCSCSVVPLAATLRQSGASRGATASFLSSTPQTGVDSILATYALLGGAFSLIRVLVAFVSGIVTGILIDLFCKDKPKPAAADFSKLSFSAITEAPKEPNPAKSSCCSNQPKRSWRDGLRYGLVTLPSDLAAALIVGLVLAGLITTLLPADLLTGSFSSGLMAFVLATAISLPLYVCATGSIPMAYALIAAGMSPGAALVFLITGPATNTTTIVTVWKMLGRAPTVIYLLCLLFISWLAGALFNLTLAQGIGEVEAVHGQHVHSSLWQHVSGFALFTLLAVNLILSRKPKKKSCCSV
ncbi:MAG: SO_0444 family Cu/Zn efflux transporter [Opitutales bacterium]